MMMTSQSMKITLMMKTMIMKTATTTTTTMMMKIMTTMTMMMKITTTMKTITTTEVVEEEETEISRETAREDLLQEAEEEVRAADREDLQVQIPADQDQDQDRVQDPAEEEGRHLQAIQMTIIMITDMIIREDREEAETAAEDLVRVPAQTPEDHRIPIQEAAEETQVQVQDQETAAVQVEAPVQDLVTVLQEEVSHQ